MDFIKALLDDLVGVTMSLGVGNAILILGAVVLSYLLIKGSLIIQILVNWPGPE
jgi:hypothetical protein